jgi:hypothetical protein
MNDPQSLHDTHGLHPGDIGDIAFALGHAFRSVYSNSLAQDMADIYYRVTGHFVTDYYTRKWR